MLETLCFDMSVEQPWVVLRRHIRGFDALLLTEDGGAESSRTAEERAKVIEQTNGHPNGKGKSKLSEQRIAEISWSLLNDA